MPSDSVCKKCSTNFLITEDDDAFYKAMNVPRPTLCPECRQQRRLAFRNTMSLYRRKCAATGKPIVSMFSTDKPLTVYDNDYWFSDSWSPFDHGIAVDFNRSFFEQFTDLRVSVPQAARSAAFNENCDFVNCCGKSKDCYLIFECDRNRECLYSYAIFESTNCMDIYQGTRCELCYECNDCTDCYELFFSEDCINCNSSYFLKSCIGCQNCFGCVNLRNKEYYIFNERHTKEEYEKRIKQLLPATRSSLRKTVQQFKEYSEQFPQKYLRGTQNENVSGDYIWNSQNCSDCYGLLNSQDCKFVYDSRNCKMVYDMTVYGDEGAEFCYEVQQCGCSIRNIMFCDDVFQGCSNVLYSAQCMQNCHNLFGCVGIRQSSNCILNRSYSKHEYEQLTKKLIEHMKELSEWGEFFPATTSLFSYNETEANLYYPLTESEAVQQGFRWDASEASPHTPSGQIPPESITEVTDEIANQIFSCQTCMKNYKVIDMELKFYRQFGIPIPSDCFNCRHSRRLQSRNQRKLWKRHCLGCQQSLQTSFAPDSNAKVYCEKCFLSETH